MVERQKYSRQGQASVKWETVILDQHLEQGAKPRTPQIPSAFGEKLSRRQFFSSRVGYNEHHLFSSEEQWVWPNTKPEYMRSGQGEYCLYQSRKVALKKLRTMSLGNTLDLYSLN